MGFHILFLCFGSIYFMHNNNPWAVFNLLCHVCFCSYIRYIRQILVVIDVAATVFSLVSVFYLFECHSIRATHRSFQRYNTWWLLCRVCVPCMIKRWRCRIVCVYINANRRTKRNNLFTKKKRWTKMRMKINTRTMPTKCLAWTKVQRPQGGTVIFQHSTKLWNVCFCSN